MTYTERDKMDKRTKYMLGEIKAKHEALKSDIERMSTGSIGLDQTKEVSIMNIHKLVDKSIIAIYTDTGDMDFAIVNIHDKHAFNHNDNIEIYEAFSGGEWSYELISNYPKQEVITSWHQDTGEFELNNKWVKANQYGVKLGELMVAITLNENSIAFSYTHDDNKIKHDNLSTGPTISKYQQQVNALKYSKYTGKVNLYIDNKLIDTYANIDKVIEEQNTHYKDQMSETQWYSRHEWDDAYSVEKTND